MCGVVVPPKKGSLKSQTVNYTSLPVVWLVSVPRGWFWCHCVEWFRVPRGEMIQIPLRAGHHRPANDTPFKWRFAGVPMMDQHRILAW